jgi:hypothetical protein
MKVQLRGAPELPHIETDLVKYVERWVGFLAKSQWTDAFALTDAPNQYGIRWSETEIRRTLTEYGCGRTPTVTQLNLMATPGRSSVVARADGSGYSVYYDLPLDGEWSDLTAQFDFTWNGESYQASLHDLHVM